MSLPTCSTIPSPRASWLLPSHLLDGSQAVQLGIAELLLEHELVEILSRIGLALQRLQSLGGGREDQPTYTHSQLLFYTNRCDPVKGTCGK